MMYTLCLDAGTASTSATDAIKIAAGHSWYANLPNTTVADIHQYLLQAQ